MPWFDWDEIHGDWSMAKPSRVRVGEEDAAGWLRLEDQGPLKVFRSKAGHLALTVEARDKREAHEIAMVNSQEYRDWGA